MSKVDDELTRRLRGAQLPVDPGEVFEGLERRRSHRERIRKVRVGVLGFVVVALSIAGFAALRAAFDTGPRDIGDGPVLPRNGEVVYSKEGDDGRYHLFAANPDGSGERQITDDATNDTDPAVSPDGKTIAFVHELDQGVRVIATVPIEGGTVTWITDEELDAHDPAWSADGTRLAFVGASQFHGFPVEDAVVFVGRPEEEPERLLHNNAMDFADPSWSPDGSMLAVAVRDAREGAHNWILVEISSDDPPQPQLRPTDVDERAPAWSPDGSRIAFVRGGAEGDEIWTRSRDGVETRIATAVEASLDPDLSWAPDGSALLVSDGDWIYRVDVTPEGDPRENFVQLMRGSSPSWQPIPAGSEPSATTSAEPTASPSQTPEGRDVGLSFNVCRPEHLGGIDYLGDGAQGNAWIGVPTDDDGTCPANPRPDAFVVAADADGNGRAEAWGQLPWECEVMCVPYAGADLDGNGTEELIVASYFSIVDHHVMRYLDPSDEPSPAIVPVLVAEPGHEPVGLRPGEPLRIDAGGDAGYSSQIECEGAPESPVLVWSWRFAPVDGEGDVEVHITKLEVRHDGLAHVTSVNDYHVPVGQPTGIEPSNGPACGVDWNPWD